MKKPRLVHIEWLDAEHEFGWQDGNDIDTNVDVVPCYSVGWLLAKNKKAVKLCQTWSTDNHAQTLVIPAGMIEKITFIDTPKEEYEHKGR